METSTLRSTSIIARSSRICTKEEGCVTGIVSIRISRQKGAALRQCREIGWKILWGHAWRKTKMTVTYWLICEYPYGHFTWLSGDGNKEKKERERERRDETEDRSSSREFWLGPVTVRERAKKFFHSSRGQLFRCILSARVLPQASAMRWSFVVAADPYLRIRLRSSPRQRRRKGERVKGSS